MPASVHELVDLLDLEAVEDNLFRGQQPDTALQRVFGGQVAAQALVSATRTVDDSYQVHSLHAYFLRPGDTKVPIVYDVDDLRDGRSFATRRVVARQHGRPIFFMTANYQRPEEGLEHAVSMPQVAAPEDCPSLLEMYRQRDRVDLDRWAKEWSALDVRWVESTDEPFRQRMWIRASAQLPSDRLTHEAVFAYATDMTLLGASLTPHDIVMGDPGLQPASLDHTIWFHRPMRADEWWLYDQFSPSASGGRGLSLAQVFTESGTLAATVAQEGLIRYSRP